MKEVITHTFSVNEDDTNVSISFSEIPGDAAKSLENIEKVIRVTEQALNRLKNFREKFVR